MKNEDRNNRRKHVKNNKDEEITGKSKKSNEINRYFAELCNRVQRGTAFDNPVVSLFHQSDRMQEYITASP
jgi:hypothetical protein